MKFKKIKPEELNDNVFKLMNKDWTLISAGNINKYNMMTASWAGLGILWNKRVCFIFIRPSRYTYKFTEDSDYFSLNFFGEKYRSVLNLCGSKSGRDINKMNVSNLTAIEKENTVYFDEAGIVLLCKKIYYQDLNPSQFLDPNIESHYNKGDYHRMYIGEIIECLRKE